MTYSFSSLNRSRYLAMAGIILAVVVGLFVVWRFVIPSLQEEGSREAQELLESSEYDAAIAELEQAVQSDNSPKVLAQLIQAYALKGNATGTEQEMYEVAYPYAKQATEMYPDNIEVLLAVGYIAETAEHYEEASEYYRKAYLLDEKNAQTLFRFAHSLEFITSDLDLVESLYQGAYQLDPENPQVLMAIGRVLLSRATTGEEIEQAFQFFMGAAERTDQASIQSEAWANAARVQLMLNKYDDAVALASKAVNADRSYAPALVVYGEAIFRQGRTQDGLGYITEAMEKNPRHSDSYRTMGILLRVLGDYDQAIQYLTTASQKIPNDNTIVGESARAETLALIQYDIARTYDMAGDADAAFTALEEAIGTDPSVASRARLEAEQYGVFAELSGQERFNSLIAE